MSNFCDIEGNLRRYNEWYSFPFICGGLSRIPVERPLYPLLMVGDMNGRVWHWTPFFPSWGATHWFVRSPDFDI